MQNIAELFFLIEVDLSVVLGAPLDLVSSPSSNTFYKLRLNNNQIMGFSLPSNICGHKFWWVLWKSQFKWHQVSCQRFYQNDMLWETAVQWTFNLLINFTMESTKIGIWQIVMKPQYSILIFK